MYNCRQEKDHYQEKDRYEKDYYEKEHYCPSWTQPSYELEWKPYWKVVWKQYPIPCPPTPKKPCDYKKEESDFYNNY